MKWIKNNKIIQSISIISTCDAEIPSTYGKSTNLIKILRTTYLIVISFLVVFSFISFAIRDENLDGIKIAIGIITFLMFLIDYVFHWISFTERDKIRKKFWYSYLYFPFTGVGIILLASTLTSIHVIQYFGVPDNEAFKYFETLTFVRIIRLVLLLKIFKPFKVLVGAFKEQKLVLSYTFVFIFLLITVFALIIWNNEVVWLDKEIRDALNLKGINIESSKELFDAEYQNLYNTMSSGVITNFNDAIYFSTVTLTTIGYGDFTPHAPNSKLIVVIISILGIAVFAIPSGVVAGAVLSHIQLLYNKSKKNEKKLEKERKTSLEENNQSDKKIEEVKKTHIVSKKEKIKQQRSKKQ